MFMEIDRRICRKGWRAKQQANWNRLSSQCSIKVKIAGISLRRTTSLSCNLQTMLGINYHKGESDAVGSSKWIPSLHVKFATSAWVLEFNGIKSSPSQHVHGGDEFSEYFLTFSPISLLELCMFASDGTVNFIKTFAELQWLRWKM